MANKKYWFAAYTKARHEKVARDYLRKKRVKTFLPVIKKKSQWSDRKKEIEEPFIKGYIFIKIYKKNILYVLETYGIVNIVRIGENYTTIPDYQIEALKKALDKRINLTVETYFSKGELVKVIGGPLKGKKGKIATVRGKSKLILNIDAIHSTWSTEINPAYVKKIKPPGGDKNDN